MACGMMLFADTEAPAPLQRQATSASVCLHVHRKSAVPAGIVSVGVPVWHGCAQVVLAAVPQSV